MTIQAYLQNIISQVREFTTAAEVSNVERILQHWRLGGRHGR